MKSLLLILLSAIVLSATTNAGELITVRGRSYGYMLDRNALIEDAKKHAIENLPFPNAKQSSQWKVGGGSCTPQSMRPQCHYSAVATFENPTETAPWYYKATGQGSGDGDEENDLALALAKKEARGNARWACNSQIVQPSDSWKIWKDDVGYLYASNSIQCLN